MKEYLRENYKIILALTLLLICTLGLTITSELQANELQENQTSEVTEKLQVVSHKMKSEYFEYTGEKIKPELVRVVVEDQNGNRIVKTSDDIVIQSYSDNINVGMADIEVSIDGYDDPLLVEDAFYIYPSKTTNLQIVQADKTSINLSWEKAPGADGYYIYRSVDGGQSFALLSEISESNVLNYQDADIQANAIYVYYIKSYVKVDDYAFCAKASDTVKQYTPLSTPVLVSAKNVAYNSICIQWHSVSGAANYQIYRSLTADGEYTKIAEAKSADTTYTDMTCDCGSSYFYYIKAGQTMEDAQVVYGEASEVKSAKTTPNKVGINGITSDYTKVTLNWKQSQGAHGYEIYRSTGNSSEYKLIKTIEQADILSWSESGLEKEQAYTYKIRPYCVLNGETITGSYSGKYEKDVYVNYDYSQKTDGDVNVLTQYVGQTYVYGGTTLKGWDCSGFTQWAFAKHYGISLGRTASEQAGGGKSVSKNDRSSWKPGDLLFYKENGKISHVAIYLGNGQMIHALNSKYDTLVQDVDYYEVWDKKTTLCSVRRYF